MSKLNFASLSFNSNQTPVSDQFDDIYFSTQDGLAESRYVFQEGNQLREKWLSHDRSAFVIAETGFGTGLNFFAVAEYFEEFCKANPDHTLKRLYFISFEQYPIQAEQFHSVHQQHPQFAKNINKLTACWEPRQVGCQRYHFDQVYLDLWFGDIAENLPQLGDSYNATIDCWFLDGFSPDKNPQMWNEHLYQQMFRLTKPQGSFATFTASSQVRRGLQSAGFDVYKRKGFGKKREMLWGEKPIESESQSIEYPYYFQSKQTNVDDIAIVGGGVASLFLALSLIEKGKRVTLYCQDGELAKNASGNAQGAIYPQLSDDDERNVRFYVHSFDYALQRLHQLTPLVPFEQGLTGVSLYAYNDKTDQKLKKMAEDEWDEKLYKLCSADELSEKVGLPLVNGGAFISQGGWLSPVQLVQNGFKYLEQQGLTIVLNHKVENLTFEHNQWHWQHNGQSFSHQAVVLANGHTLKQFQQIEGIQIYPVRGQVSQVPTNENLSQLKSVLCYDGYLTPVSAQQTHCLGASHVRDNLDTTFSLTEHQQNIAKLQQNLTACDWTRGIDGSDNKAKVGVRAAFRDRIPMVGAVPNYPEQKIQYKNLYNLKRRRQPIPIPATHPNLYLLAGLGSRGLTTAPLLGELLASQIANEPLPLSQDILFALMPNRSWIRSLLKGRQLD